MPEFRGYYGDTRPTPTPRPEPGEWQIEEGTGKRYRMIGNIKEYEMMVTIAGVEVPQSEVEEFNRRRKAAEERRRAEENEALKNKPSWSCPLLDGTSATCRGGSCAWYDGRCAMEKALTCPPIRETKGKTCPLNRYRAPCSERCVLYAGGCKLTGINNKMEDQNNGNQV